MPKNDPSSLTLQTHLSLSAFQLLVGEERTPRFESSGSSLSLSLRKHQQLLCPDPSTAGQDLPLAPQAPNSLLPPLPAHPLGAEELLCVSVFSSELQCWSPGAWTSAGQDSNAHTSHSLRKASRSSKLRCNGSQVPPAAARDQKACSSKTTCTDVRMLRFHAANIYLTPAILMKPLPVDTVKRKRNKL